MAFPQPHTAVDTVRNDLLDRGYVAVRGPEEVDWVGTLSIFRGTLTKVAAIVRLDRHHATPECVASLCYHLDQWAASHHGAGRALLVIVILLADVSCREMLDQIQGTVAALQVHITLVGYDTATRQYCGWQPAIGLQRSEYLLA